MEENKGYDWSTELVKLQVAELRDKIAKGTEYFAHRYDRELKSDGTRNKCISMKKEEEMLKRNSHFKTKEECFEEIFSSRHKEQKSR